MHFDEATLVGANHQYVHGLALLTHKVFKRNLQGEQYVFRNIDHLQRRGDPERQDQHLGITNFSVCRRDQNIASSCSTYIDNFEANHARSIIPARHGQALYHEDGGVRTHHNIGTVFAVVNFDQHAEQSQNRSCDEGKCSGNERAINLKEASDPI